MRKSTFKLTKHEFNIISDADFMRTKQLVIKNICDYFNLIGERLITKYYADIGINHKVTRGENYLDMPYVVLDVPQLKANNLSQKLRVMFWWGNDITLQYFVEATSDNFNLIKKLPGQNNYVLITNNLFNNQVKSNDFVATNELTTNSLEGLRYTKIVQQLPLTYIDDMETCIAHFIADLKISKLFS